MFCRHWKMNEFKTEYETECSNIDNKFEIGARYLNDNLHIALKLMSNCVLCCVRYFIVEFSRIAFAESTNNETNRKMNEQSKKKRENHSPYAMIARTVKDQDARANCNIHHKTCKYLLFIWWFGASCLRKICQNAIKLHKQKVNGVLLNYLSSICFDWIVSLNRFVCENKRCETKIQRQEEKSAPNIGANTLNRSERRANGR